MSSDILVLHRSEVETLLTLPECIQAMKVAFQAYSNGQALPPALMHVDGDGAEFHIKGGGLRFDRLYFALKANGSNFSNISKLGIPNMMGIILLFDGTTGQLLACMDSIRITILRTGAITGLAARYLARPDSSVVTICGSGAQGRIQLAALREVFPAIRKVNTWDIVDQHAVDFARELNEQGQLEAEVVHDLGTSAKQSDIIVTCTPAKGYYLRKEFIRPGTFIAAVGSDSPDKQELEPQLLGISKLVVDILDQCARVGELHHALDAGIMTRSDVFGELGDLVTGKLPGRTSDEEITIFDTTGSAIQDTAAAVTVYQKALENNLGKKLDLSQ